MWSSAVRVGDATTLSRCDRRHLKASPASGWPRTAIWGGARGQTRAGKQNLTDAGHGFIAGLPTADTASSINRERRPAAPPSARRRKSGAGESRLAKGYQTAFHTIARRLFALRISTLPNTAASRRCPPQGIKLVPQSSSIRLGICTQSGIRRAAADAGRSNSRLRCGRESRSHRMRQVLC